MRTRFFRAHTLYVLPLLLFAVPALAGSVTVHLVTTLDDVTVDKTASGDFARIGLHQSGVVERTIDDAGQPVLPYWIVRVLLPKGHEVVRHEVESSGTVMVSEGFRPVLSAPVKDPAIGAAALPSLVPPRAGGRFPGETSKYLGTGYWHGYAIASFAVFPLALQDGSLLLFDNPTLRVVTQPQSLPSDVAVPQRLSSRAARAIGSRLDQMVANRGPGLGYPPLPRAAAPRGRFAPTAAPSLEGSPVDYLIITTEALAETYQRLADWKTSKGVPAVVRTVEWIEANHRHGVDTQETLRLFIREAYEKWGIRWVLLGGDTPEIPPRYCFTTFFYGGKYIPADLYYAGLDGSWNDDHDDIWGEALPTAPIDNPDLYADVFVGRLPTSTIADADAMIDKIISYETPADPSYMDKAMFLAEVLFPYPWSPGQEIDVNGAFSAEYVLGANPPMEAAMRLVRAYETPDYHEDAIQESKQQALDSLQAGYNFVFDIGHGFRFNMHVADDNIVISDADALVNPDRYFNLNMLNCTAAAFNFDCLAERFLKNVNGGAVSVIGASESAFATTASYYMTDYCSLLFEHGWSHIGEVFAVSRERGTPVAELGDNGELWTHYIYTLLADPEMPLWTDVVTPLTAGHPDSVVAGKQTIQVDVMADAAPAESVLVCLWKPGEDYQYGYTDAGGMANFDFAVESAGTVSVTATGYNYGRYDGMIVATQSAVALLRFVDAAVDDDSINGTVGNNDAVIDAGEIVQLTPTIENTGVAVSATTTLTLRSADPLVTIADSVATIGPLAGGAVGAAGDPWQVTFSPLLTDEAAVSFDVVIDDGGPGAWVDSFSRVVHAPSLSLTTLRLDDSAPLGNGDGIIDAGEEFRLYIGIKNHGTGEAPSLAAGILDLDGAFTFFDSTDTYFPVPSLEEHENLSGFHISESSVLSEHRVEVTIFDVHLRTIKDTLELRAPPPPSNLRFDTSLGEDKIVVAWDASPDTTVTRYRVWRSATTGGPYAVADVDLLDHTVFTDVGLAPATRYYYVVTAIDSSGNESGYSVEASASTNPPQMTGWPNLLAGPSATSPVVGDIDGDGDLEVVVGDDRMYAWHHDGYELTDGDDDPLTWGVLSSAGTDFIGAAALAPLDQMPGLDIVAPSHATKEVYCFNANGSVLSGWPQPTNDKVRANVAVGDLDNDGSYEIITIDQQAWLYVWHQDGTEYTDGDGDPMTHGVFRRFPNTPWIHYQAPAVCDIDGDQMDEIIVGTQDSTLYVLNGDGSDVPGWPRQLLDFAAGSVAVGDIDDDGDLEIVIGTKNASQFQALHHDNTVLWGRFLPQNLFFNPSPALADLTGDGKLETVIPSSNGKLYIITSTGANLPGWPIVYANFSYTESSPIIADLDGDGQLDIALGDETKYINAWDLSGNLLDGFPLATQDAIRGTPVVADLDRDGDAEIVAAGFDRLVYTWDLAAPYVPENVAWPMFRGNVRRTGEIGFDVPTGIDDVAFSFSVVGTSVRLQWHIPETFGGTFDLFRDCGDAGQFELVATGILAMTGTVSYEDDGVTMGRSYVYKLQPVDDPTQAFVSNPVYVGVTRAALDQNFPNPFNPSTSIVFYVPEGGPRPVTLVVYDVTGARVRTLQAGHLGGGRYVRVWDGRNDQGARVGTGVYFCRLSLKDFSATRKMVLLK